MNRLRDEWTNATCREETHQEWARQHRGSRWDFTIDGEEKQPLTVRRTRRAEAVALCADCPLLTKCATRHHALSVEVGRNIPGIWAGRIYSDYDTTRPAVADAA